MYISAVRIVAQSLRPLPAILRPTFRFQLRAERFRTESHLWSTSVQKSYIACKWARSSGHTSPTPLAPPLLSYGIYAYMYVYPAVNMQTRRRFCPISVLLPLCVDPRKSVEYTRRVVLLQVPLGATAWLNDEALRL